MAGKKAHNAGAALAEPKELPAEEDGTGAALPEAASGEATEREGEGWDAEGEHTMAVERMAGMIDETDFIADGELVFDVRDFLLDVIKSRPKPWSATSQAEQRDVAAACEHTAKELVRKIVEAVAARGQTDAIRVLLTKVNAGSDIVLTGKVKFVDDDPSERDKAILSLHHSINKHVMLTRASADDYSTGAREAETDPDEPDLDFEAGPEDDSDLAGDQDDDDDAGE
jgi:hypothetical protein